MMSTSQSNERSIGGCVVIGTLVLGITLLCSTGTVSAGWLPGGPSETIVRDGAVQNLNPALMNMAQGSMQYKYIEDIYLGQSIAHSGAASVGSQAFQDVYVYNNAAVNTNYSALNTTNYGNSFLFSEADADWRNGAPVLRQDSVPLNGSLIVAKSSVNSNQLGLLASFNVVASIKYEFQNAFGGFVVERPLMLGGIDLMGWVNDRVLVRPRGSLTWNKIGSVENETEKIEQKVLTIGTKEIALPLTYLDMFNIDTGGDRFQINLENIELSYRYVAFAGVPTTISVHLVSSSTTKNGNSGAEVIFMPDEAPSSLPSFQDGNVIPEPAAIILLLSGSVFGAFRKGRFLARKRG